jgi:hypothetical protein
MFTVLNRIRLILGPVTDDLSLLTELGFFK